MRIIKKISVVPEATNGKIVDKYLCNRCGKKVKELPRIEIDRELKYSRFIYCLCEKCDKI